MNQQNETQETIQFKNVQEILNKLNISRATFYRRANALGMQSNKRFFTLSELEKLKERSFSESKQNKTSQNNEMFRDVLRDRDNYLDEIKHSYDLIIQSKDKALSDKQSELDKQSIQLEEAKQDKNDLKKLLDQQQKLSLQLKIELSETQEKPKRGFWARLFGFK